jgi:hypothetical protein
MRLSTKQLLIAVNPFAAPLAVDGRAMALCAVDPAAPMGGQYIGANTRAKADPSRRSMLAVGGKALGRDKISVDYNLAPVRVPDTSYYRQALRAGDVFEVPGHEAKLLGAALAALAQHVAEGGDREKALAAWRAQGLAAVADAISPVLVKLPPGDDALKIAPATGVPNTPIEGDVLDVHAVTPPEGLPAVIATEGVSP